MNRKFYTSDITQKGYEKKRAKLISAYLPQPPGLEVSMAHECRPPMVPSSASRYHRRRSSGTRDERYRSGESGAMFTTVYESRGD
ncbi:disco-interacting protein 2 homolog C isoform X1 [Tachysurus ichikawai]